MLIIPSRTPTTSNNYPTNSLRFTGVTAPSFQRSGNAGLSGSTWTVSFWMKKGQKDPSATAPCLFRMTRGANGLLLTSSGDILNFSGDNGSATTYAVLRDFSAWYHVVVSCNASNVTIYLNGVYIGGANGIATLFPTGMDTIYIGSNASIYPFVGLLADFYLIDGQALTPSAFASTDAASGQWRPAPYTGAYGANGFHLEFKDTSGNTTSSNTGIGKDTSGNGKYFTTTGFNTTSTSYLYDCLTDVPAPASATSANYFVLNPLNPKPISGSTGLPTLSNANLTATGIANAALVVWSSAPITPDKKWKFEVTINAVTSGTGNFVLWLCDAAGTVYVSWSQTGGTLSGGGTASTATTFAAGDVLTYQIDGPGQNVALYKNGTLVSSAATGWAVPLYFAAYMGSSTPGAFSINFGQQPFLYGTAGYGSCNVANMAAPTIALPKSHFDVALYTGNGTSQTINSLAFQPDLVWVKNRSTTTDHVVSDLVRGVAQNLYPDAGNSESAGTSAITAFTSSGFSVGNNNGTNSSLQNFVAWCWKAGNSTASNTNGSITSTVSVNPTAGFSIVQYQGTGANATVGHGLGVAPKFIIIKDRNVSSSWIVWHQGLYGLGTTAYILLNSDTYYQTGNAMWNSTYPGASVFNIGSDANVNTSGHWYIAYCFADVPGFSQSSYYTGNGQADGPFVYTGFRPRYIIGKTFGGTSGWWVIDAARTSSSFNSSNTLLYPSQITAEQNYGPSVDILSNGFKVRVSGSFGTDANSNGGNYLYTAFAEAPFQYANAR